MWILAYLSTLTGGQDSGRVHMTLLKEFSTGQGVCESSVLRESLK